MRYCGVLTDAVTYRSLLSVHCFLSERTLLTSTDLSFTEFTTVKPFAYFVGCPKYALLREGNLLGHLTHDSGKHIWISGATRLSLDDCLCK